MSYMDQRSGDIRMKYSGRPPRVAGASIPFVLSSLYHTGVFAGSDKDPVWKYLWVKEHEPELYNRVYKWLDVKDALVARMTGKFTMSRDSAFATLLLDRKKHTEFSKALLKRLGIDPRHMPAIVDSAEEVGGLTLEAAGELDLAPGIPVFSGGSDAALIGVGAGCVSPGQAHIYMGTSGWASVVTDRPAVDAKAMIASVVGVQDGLYNYFAELETAGKCLEWVRDHLALDEINIYLRKMHVAEDPESVYENLYDYLSDIIATVPDSSAGFCLRRGCTETAARSKTLPPARCFSTSGSKRENQSCCVPLLKASATICAGLWKQSAGKSRWKIASALSAGARFRL